MGVRSCVLAVTIVAAPCVAGACEFLVPVSREELFLKKAAPCGDLRSLDLRGAELTDFDLRGADLSGADLRGAVLDGADLTGAVLRRADLGPTKAPSTPTSLRGARLSGADLEGASLRSADLFHADLRGARMPGSWGKLQSADLSGADLRGTDLSSVYLPFVTVTGARYDAVTRFASSVSRAPGGGWLGKKMTPQSRGMIDADAAPDTLAFGSR